MLLSGVFLCHLPPYVLRKGEPGPHQFQQASWLASPKEPSVSTAQCWNIDVCLHGWLFNMGTRDPNSGPHLVQQALYQLVISFHGLCFVLSPLCILIELGAGLHKGMFMQSCKYIMYMEQGFCTAVQLRYQEHICGFYVTKFLFWSLPFITACLVHGNKESKSTASFLSTSFPF